jgi:hypothetical protein
MQTTAQQGTGVFAFEIADSAGLELGRTERSSLTPIQEAKLGEQLGPIFGINWSNISVSDIKDTFDSRWSDTMQSGVGVLEEQLSKAASASTAFGAGIASQRVPVMKMQTIFFRVLVESPYVVTKMVEGKLLFVFKTQIRYASFVVEGLFPTHGFATIDTRTQAPSKSSQIRSAAGNPFRGSGGVFLVIGASLNIAAYIAKDGEKFLSDLFVDIAADIATAVISSIVVVGIIVATGYGALLITGGFWIAISVAAVTMLVGWKIKEAIWEPIADEVKLALRNFITSTIGILEDSWHQIHNDIVQYKKENTNYELPEHFREVDFWERAFGGTGIRLDEIR